MLWKQANAEEKENVDCNYGTWCSSGCYFSAEECAEPGVVGPVDFRMTKAIYEHSQWGNGEQPSRVKAVLNSDADHTPVQTEVLYSKKIRSVSDLVAYMWLKVAQKSDKKRSVSMRFVLFTLPLDQINSAPVKYRPCVPSHLRCACALVWLVSDQQTSRWLKVREKVSSQTESDLDQESAGNRHWPTCNLIRVGNVVSFFCFIAYFLHIIFRTISSDICKHCYTIQHLQ